MWRGRRRSRREQSRENQLIKREFQGAQNSHAGQKQFRQIKELKSACFGFRIQESYVTVVRVVLVE